MMRNRWLPHIFAAAALLVFIVLGLASDAETTPPATGSGNRVALSEVTAEGETLAEQLQWIRENLESGNAFRVNVANNESISSQTLSFAGQRVAIRLAGTGGERTIAINGQGHLFIVESGVTLTLDRNIVLKGGAASPGRAVRVDRGGALIMLAGSRIAGGNDGGVFIPGGTFTMRGGEIRDNNGGVGAAVDVGQDGTFVMEGGEIRGNTARTDGGAVIVNSNNATFRMTGGAIHGNTSTRHGAAVLSNGTMVMTGGEIRDNRTEHLSAVRIGGGTFTMEGGTIRGNRASWGAGVGVTANATFNMSGGTISGNIATGGGGGVNNEGTFRMTNGTISGNTAGEAGGGVRVASGTFTKTGGTIAADNKAAGNIIVTAPNNKNRTTAAGAGDNIDSAKIGRAGGWDDYTGIYQIVLRNGMAIDVRNPESNSNGVAIHQWTKRENLAANDSQRWRITLQDDGTYTILTNRHSRAMDIQHREVRNGANIHQWEHNPTQRSQRWQIIPLDDGWVNIVNAQTGLYLDMSNSNFTNRGHQFHTWSRNNGQNQQFQLIKLD